MPGPPTHPPLHPYTPSPPARAGQALGRSTMRPVACLMTAPLVDFAPDPSAGWPPPGGFPVPGGSYLVLHGRHGHGAAAPDGPDPTPLNDPKLLPRRRLLAAAAAARRLLHQGGPAAHAPDAQGAGQRGEGWAPGLVADVTLELGYALAVFSIASDGEQLGGLMELQSLRLAQLGQGPSAREAASLDDPSVWTIMLWGFHRWGGVGRGVEGGAAGWGATRPASGGAQQGARAAAGSHSMPARAAPSPMLCRKEPAAALPPGARDRAYPHPVATVPGIPTPRRPPPPPAAPPQDLWPGAQPDGRRARAACARV